MRILKNSLATLFGCLFCAITLSQNSVYVKYEKTVADFKTEQFLVATSDSSVFSTRAIRYENQDKIRYEDSKDKSKVLVREKLVQINQQKIYANSSNNHLIFESIGKIKTYIAKDTPDSYKWKIVEGETKEISGFKCQKALTTFRGSQFTAWFCADIPIMFGPWKLKGTPGLILELYACDGNSLLNRWTATEIIVPFKYNGFFYPNNLNLIQSYESLIKERDKINSEKMKIFVTKLPQKYKRGMSETKRTGLERFYEWETKAIEKE